MGGLGGHAPSGVCGAQMLVRQMFVVNLLILQSFYKGFTFFNGDWVDYSVHVNVHVCAAATRQIFPVTQTQIKKR